MVEDRTPFQDRRSSLDQILREHAPLTSVELLEGPWPERARPSPILAPYTVRVANGFLVDCQTAAAVRELLAELDR